MDPDHSKLFKKIVQNSYTNILCCESILTNAVLIYNLRKEEYLNLIRSMKIDELEIKCSEKASYLSNNVIETSNKYKDDANFQISTLKKQYRQQKRKIFKEIEDATERLKKVTESIEISKIAIKEFKNQNNSPILESTKLYNDEKYKQLQRTNENIKKLSEKKSQWTKMINELKEIEISRKDKLPLRITTNNHHAFKDIINS